ncbi:MAG: dihydroneopterin aldolase [Verrucomicrobiota bacterium]|jgi:FolB domain-containing protein
MADQIKITDLEVNYRIGVPDEERAHPQRLTLTITMLHDFGQAARTDQVGRTIDYFAVTQWLQKYGEQRTWKLLETLAVNIAEEILQRFRPQSVTVEVKKFIIKEAAHVSVSVSRARAR